MEVGSTSCMPCLSIKKRITRYIAQVSNIHAYYVPIEKYPEVAQELDIYSAPSVLLYVDGKLISKQSGYFSLDQIFYQVERTLHFIRGCNA
ncbi:MAG: thioredoxin family protein [Erysipelotrichaceae bacterium]|nr:thioredoxin family protein [Erysipelotrichaceae bacterium]